MNLSDVTIIIPFWVPTEEHVTWAVEAIESAVAQQCSVVVYDDGSPDEHYQYVVRTAPGPQYIKGPRKGVGHTRNRAVEHAKTALILPLDCDDKLAPGAVQEFLNYWDGKPVYSDVLYFGERQGAFKLKDFSCEALKEAVGLATVTVLHSRQQWYQIGGWNEELPLYEDGEYNARLMGNFCGVKISKPLLMYRQHPNQRSKNPDGKRLARQIHGQYIRNIERTNFMCCGQKKQNQNMVSPNSLEAMPSQPTASQMRDMNTRPELFHLSTPVSPTTSLPGAVEGRVRARYLGGKGKGAHYYRGVHTKFPYKVQYGQELMVDANDAVYSHDQVNLGTSLFLALEQPKQKEQPKKQETAPKFFRPTVGDDSQVAREPREGMTTKEPVLMVEEHTQNLPDIINMTIREISNQDITPAMAKLLIKVETANKNRVGAIAELQAIIDEDEVYHDTK